LGRAGQDQLSLEIIGDECDSIGRQSGSQGAVGPAGFQDSQNGADHGRAVVQEQDHRPIVTSVPAENPVCDAVGGAVQLPVGHLSTIVEKGRSLAKALDDPLKAVWNGPF